MSANSLVLVLVLVLVIECLSLPLRLPHYWLRLRRAVLIRFHRLASYRSLWFHSSRCAMRSSRLCGLILFCIVPLSSHAVISSGSVENINAIIPDGNLNGIQSSLTLSGLPNFITD